MDGGGGLRDDGGGTDYVRRGVKVMGGKDWFMKWEDGWLAKLLVSQGTKGGCSEAAKVVVESRGERGSPIKWIFLSLLLACIDFPSCHSFG